MLYEVITLHADVTRLPFWNLVREDRLYGVRRVPQTRHHIPSFGYDQAMANLSSQPPRWPEPTNGISEIRLELRFRPQRGLLGHRITSYNVCYTKLLRALM